MHTDEPSFVDVDEHNLDTEWVAQPRLFRREALRAAEARMAHAEAKARLEMVEAELQLEIREDPDAFNLPKATEATIQACILVQKRYKEAQKALIIAKYELDKVEAGVSALEHKKKALENLVQLEGRAYFAEPVAGEGPARERVQKAATGAVRGQAAGKLNGKKREG